MSIPTDRCGYTIETGDIRDGGSGIGGSCCWRPVLDERNRCIWHADVEQKDSTQLLDEIDETTNHLGGVVASNVSFPDELTIIKSSFVNANLRATELRNATLRNNFFAEADLSESDLSGTDLRRADLHESDLSNANLISANLTEADVSDVLAPGINLSEADLREADFSGGDLRKVTLSNADLAAA